MIPNHSSNGSPSSNGHSCTIAATATAVPPFTITREDVKRYIGQTFNINERRIEAMMTIVDNAQVHKRHCIFPIDYTIEPRSLSKTNEEYQEHAIALGRRAAEESLVKAGVTPADVDLIITVSCTGYMVPSLDAHLLNLMGFRSNVRRLPITELGCVAGAMALSRAWDFLRGSADMTVLVVAVELPSLTFQRKDISQANLISAILFGDGAAAAVLTNRPSSGPRILDAESFTLPGSIDALGFDLRDSGFHIVLSKDVPQLLREKIKGLVEDFLGRNHLTPREMAAYLLHPGGQKLLTCIEEELDLQRSETEFSWDVLRDYGNISSATILFILQEWLTKRKMNAGDYGLMAGFGPGFSSELLLLQWT
ncbi:MAG TPA: 3-oxoacyl-[acyl-carrier-protein] synthase III C-terminal domain-containing protein [Candidatus Acidoferrales bacterium]|nr:3-oxoacyl-[acyl-carrier-protein] synthase III C-terminal domain-containing protein [Candidatus Acidoferrales bacterium]